MNKHHRKPAILAHTNIMPITQIFRHEIRVVGSHESTDINELLETIASFKHKINKLEDKTHFLFSTKIITDKDDAVQSFKKMYDKEILNLRSNLCNLYFSEN